FIDALFGHPCRTACVDEYAMSQAYVASLRSSASRQVGASIVDEDGEVLALGANEAPRAFGGQQWARDPDAGGRADLTAPVDSNREMIDGIVADLFERMMFRKMISESTLSELDDPKSHVQLLEHSKRQGLFRPLRDAEAGTSLAQKARIEQVIEYVRAV